MTVLMNLHPDLSYMAGITGPVEVSGGTVGECIQQLVAEYPILKESVFYRDGSLQTFVEIYVNRKAVYVDELNHRVSDGDEIHLTLTIAGG